MPQARRQAERHVDDERRAATVAGLVSLRANGQLSRDHVARAAEGLGVGERTVWRWISGGERSERSGRFELSADDMVELTYWHGNVAACRRARAGAPSLTTLYRAVARATTPGQRAGIGSGEQARREFDTYLIRQPTHRNEVWEADHVRHEAPFNRVEMRRVPPLASRS